MIDPKHFKDFPDIKVGDRVAYQSSDVHRDGIAGTGTVELIWLGIEEMCKIKSDSDGKSYHLCRALKDTVEKLDDIRAELRTP